MRHRNVHREVFGDQLYGSEDEDESHNEEHAYNRLVARRHLTEQAAPESPDGPRERALRALAETAEALYNVRVSRSWDPEALPLYCLGEDAESELGLLRLFWTENSAVLIAGARDRVRAARREAAKALHLLAAETSIGNLMWMDEPGARAALLTNVASGAGQDEDVRWSAHAALSLIACTESCATQMWHHAATRIDRYAAAKR